MNHASRALAFALFSAASLLFPGVAHAGYELVPFGGYTQLSNGDVACDGEMGATTGGVGIGAGAPGFFNLGVRIANVRGTGDCDTRVSMTSLSIYGQAGLFRYYKSAVGVGFDLPVGGSGTARIGDGPERDFSPETGFGGEIWYLHYLNQGGTMEVQGRDWPIFMIELQIRAGYRVQEAKLMDEAFNETSFAIDGAYVHGAFVFYLNPQAQ